ncbi:transcription-repair coupling factor [Pseudofrancisella aestuarii]|uniref:Transcription-repair-coupling factor n=1 Tax=Pseudofrancisella aestuarii TaxID=2670347 RepID=A0ABV9T8V4_9GAMM|nr:transcription-repair coupling factor [Pseudofrancisella aestuarii]
MIPNTINSKDTIISNAYGPSFSIFIKEFIKSNNNFHFIITEDSQQASKIYDELKYLTKDSKLEVLYFPSLEILAYDRFSASNDILSTRQKILYKLENNPKNTILISNISTILKKLAPKIFLEQNSFILKVNDTFDITKQKSKLIDLGYSFVNNVFEKGEFSIRGNIIDIYPIGSNIPYRIDLFDDEVDSIKELDIETQRSSNSIEEISLIPTHEIIYNNDSINLALNKLEDFFGSNVKNSSIVKYIKNKEFFSGIEFYTPLFYKKLENIFDYLPQNLNIHLFGDIYSSINAFTEEVKNRYKQLNIDIDRPILEYRELFLTLENIQENIKNYKVIKWLENDISKSKILPIDNLPNINANYKLNKPFNNLQNFLDNKSFEKIIFSTDTLGRGEILQEHLKKIGLKLSNFKSLDDALNSDSKYSLIYSPFQEGIVISSKIVIITESELFPEHTKAIAKSKNFDDLPTVDLKDLTDLKKGMHIVHINYGIGKYEGLEILEINNKKDEFILLKYADNAKIYVPVTSLNLISIYNSSITDNIVLNKLGTDKWSKQKDKAIKRIIDVAANLLEIYAKRELKQGFSNHLDEQEYLRFCADFPYEETLDQQKAISDVFKDMIASKPMDRLICGDVGFGKTEVAMRAAFLATHNQKQVAILVPTTILAQQHYNNFRDRFANTAVNIEVITRSKTAKKQEELFEDLEKGNVDIIIGTHKLISSKIKFKNLGLLIIDEEHRFGVDQKEKLKALKAEIDILTMSATPIPRSLSMAFSSLRDLSIIASPPAKRLSVKTFVKEYDSNIVREAILRETMRGGQIFYLHNHVETIQKKKEILEEMFPKCRITVAHGQMSEREIQKVMFDFKHNKFHILLCTTIIETGIDIPNANTLIIENANKFGLAQLHQLRGRVGRSHHQAYAYLLISDETSITKDARKRLDAIDSTDSLGGGFMLANHDLEIRGAGEILGKEQSGNIDGIGLNLYMELLDKTIANIKAGKELNVEELINANTCEVELNIPTLITDDYVNDVNTRLNIYKRISKADHKQLIDIKIELIDRFGLLPLEVQYLLKVAHIRLDAMKLGIQQIKMFSTSGKIVFSTPLKFDPSLLIKAIQSRPMDFKLSKDQDLLITKITKTAEERLSFIESFIKLLTKN